MKFWKGLESNMARQRAEVLQRHKWRHATKPRGWCLDVLAIADVWVAVDWKFEQCITASTQAKCALTDAAVGRLTAVSQDVTETRLAGLGRRSSSTEW
jgi:hypothetical protein